MSDSVRLHERPLTFTHEQIQQINQILQRLSDSIAAPLVMVADISGRIVSYQGRLSPEQGTGLAALAAGSFAASTEIGNFLGLNKGFQQQLLEGNLASLYILAVGVDLILITAFTKKTTLGLVRLYTQLAQKQLMQIARVAAIAREQNQDEGWTLNNDFRAEIVSQLNELIH